MIHRNKKSGFTFIEVLVGVGALSILILVIGVFQRDIFLSNTSLQLSINSIIDSRQVVREILSEVRKASPSSLGTYPIASATEGSFVFFANIDEDNLRERIRYFLENNELKKGVIKPSGNPLVYESGDESVKTIIKDISNTDIFSYHDTNYDGTTAALSFPINIPAVRLIKVKVDIDKDPSRPPAAITVTSQATMRNLKDNL